MGSLLEEEVGRSWSRALFEALALVEEGEEQKRVPDTSRRRRRHYERSHLGTYELAMANCSLLNERLTHTSTAAPCAETQDGREGSRAGADGKGPRAGGGREPGGG